MLIRVEIFACFKLVTESTPFSSVAPTSASTASVPGSSSLGQSSVFSESMPSAETSEHVYRSSESVPSSTHVYRSSESFSASTGGSTASRVSSGSGVETSQHVYRSSESAWQGGSTPSISSVSTGTCFL